MITFNLFIFLNFSVPTLGQIQNNYHPGYVPSSKPHLPTLSGTYSRPQASETFKVSNIYAMFAGNMGPTVRTTEIGISGGPPLWLIE